MGGPSSRGLSLPWRRRDVNTRDTPTMACGPNYESAILPGEGL